jgi:hypothetical protein
MDRPSIDNSVSLLLEKFHYTWLPCANKNCFKRNKISYQSTATQTCINNNIKNNHITRPEGEGPLGISYRRSRKLSWYSLPRGIEPGWPGVADSAPTTELSLSSQNNHIKHIEFHGFAMKDICTCFSINTMIALCTNTCTCSHSSITSSL